MNFTLRDKDFIKAKDIFFQVLGYIHPADSVIAIPRYKVTTLPTIWRNHDYYSRIFSQYTSSELKKIEEEMGGEIFKYDPFLDSVVPIIELRNIKKVYLTNKWREYSRREDTLLSRFQELIEILKQNIGLNYDDFGLTGSMLIGIHNPIYSDIDLVTYGYGVCEKVKEFILANPYFITKDSVILPDLDKKSFETIAQRKWNKCKYKGRIFSINPVRKYEEIKVKYGDIKIKNIKSLRTKLKIKEKIDPYFYPLRYKVTSEKDLEELTIYEYYYFDSFEEGDELEVYGMLQKVIERDREYKRIAYGVREIKNQYLRILHNNR